MKQGSVEGASATTVLALETSSRTYAVAVGDGETPLAQAAARRDDPEFPELGVLVDGALARAGLAFSDIGTIGVDVGQVAWRPFGRPWPTRMDSPSASAWRSSP